MEVKAPPTFTSGLHQRASELLMTFLYRLVLVELVAILAWSYSSHKMAPEALARFGLDLMFTAAIGVNIGCVLI